MMFHIVQPYGPSGVYTKATVVKSFTTADAAWEHLDTLYARMASTDVPLDAVELVVVDDARGRRPATAWDCSVASRPVFGLNS